MSGKKQGLARLCQLYDITQLERNEIPKLKPSSLTFIIIQVLGHRAGQSHYSFILKDDTQKEQEK